MRDRSGGGVTDRPGPRAARQCDVAGVRVETRFGELAYLPRAFPAELRLDDVGLHVPTPPTSRSRSNSSPRSVSARVYSVVEAKSTDATRTPSPTTASSRQLARARRKTSRRVVFTRAPVPGASVSKRVGSPPALRGESNRNLLGRLASVLSDLRPSGGGPPWPSPRPLRPRMVEFVNGSGPAQAARPDDDPESSLRSSTGSGQPEIERRQRHSERRKHDNVDCGSAQGNDHAAQDRGDRSRRRSERPGGHHVILPNLDVLFRPAEGLG